MKNYYLIIAFFLLFTNCSTPDPEARKAEAMTAINGFYSAMTDFDYEAMHTFCTDDFYCIDDSKIFENIDEFISVIKTYEGSTAKIDLDVLKVDIESKSALIILMFDVDITMGDKNWHIKAIENHVLKKVAGKWLINFIHSTPMKENGIIGV